MPILTSLLDTDFYKLTMMQCIFHHAKSTRANYKLICRKNDIGSKLGPLKETIQNQIDLFCQLTFQPDEIEYLRSLGVFQQDFLEYLSSLKLQKKYIQVRGTETLFELKITGPWVETILFEVPLLAILSESYTRTIETPKLLSDAKLRLEHKIELIKIQPQDDLKDFKFADLGTRRRFSKKWHIEAINLLTREIPNFLCGSSNIFLSKQLGTQPIGTIAHEYIQAFQILSPDLALHQRVALELWLKEYKGLKPIALTDVINMDSFLKELTPELALQYGGLRHDSGDPILWGNKAIQYYTEHNISLKEKKLVFSDSLTFPKMLEIYRTFHKSIPVLLGIGTNLTNDFKEPPLDIVIKLTHINEQAVVKLSDTPEKIVCEDPKMLERLKQTYRLN